MEVSKIYDAVHDTPITCMAYDKCRKLLYTAAEGKPAIIKVWDLRLNRLLRCQGQAGRDDKEPVGHRGMITCMVYAQNECLLFTGSVDGSVCVWNDKGQQVQVIDGSHAPAPPTTELHGKSTIAMARPRSVGRELNSPIFCMAYNPRRRILALGGRKVVFLFKVSGTNAVRVMRAKRSDNDRDTDRHLRILQTIQGVPPMHGPEFGHKDNVTCIVFTATGKVFTGAHDGCICIFDHEKPRDTFKKLEKCHTAGIVSMACDTLNNWVITGSFDGSLKVWSTEGHCLDAFEGLSDMPTQVAYVPFAHCYWVISRFHKINVFDPKGPANITEQVIETSSLGKHRCSRLYTPLGTDMVVAATEDRDLVVWDYNHAAAYRTFPHAGVAAEAMICVRMAEPRSDGIPNGCDHIFTTTPDGRVLHWMLEAESSCITYRLDQEHQQHEGAILCLRWETESGCLITGGEDCMIQLHHSAKPQPLEGEGPLPTFFEGHSARVTGISVLSNEVLCSISHDKTLRTWDLHTMKPLACVEGAADEPLTGMDYCPEREEVITCSQDKIAKVWNLSRPHAPKLSNVLRGHTLEITAVRWVPFKKMWATASDDGTLRLWDDSGFQKQLINIHGGSVQTSYVDAVHGLLVLTMMDRVVRGYDLKSPTSIVRYMGHEDLVRGVAYVPEIKHYMTVGWDKTMRLWNLPLEHDKEGSARLARLRDDDQFRVQEEEVFVSQYEKKNPLKIPPSLLKDNSWMEALNLGTETSNNSANTSAKGPRTKGRRKGGLKGGGEPEGPPLANRIDALEKQLYNEIKSKWTVQGEASEESQATVSRRRLRGMYSRRGSSLASFGRRSSKVPLRQSMGQSMRSSPPTKMPPIHQRRHGNTVESTPVQTDRSHM